MVVVSKRVLVTDALSLDARDGTLGWPRFWSKVANDKKGR